MISTFSTQLEKRPLPDVVLGNEVGQLDQVSVGKYFSNSDHLIIRFRLVTEMNKEKSKYRILNWKRTNFYTMKCNQDIMEPELPGEVIREQGVIFKEELPLVQAWYIPTGVKSKGAKNRAPWMRREIEIVMKRKKEGT